jgi:hypothetical protein
VRGLGQALGLGLALLGGQALAATPAETATFDVRTQITWNPSGSVWVGALAPARCGARMVPVAGQASGRVAAYVQRGEMIAEFLAPGRLTPVAIAGAQACAVEAADATGTPALLSAAEVPLQAFRGAFAACLVRQGSTGQLGGMRLWIDTSCDW